MKIRQICMVVLLWLGVIPAVQAQSFDKLWKEVEQAGKKSLPKTVIKLTDEIYRKGEKEKNSAQMLKAYMWRMKYQEIVTPDSFYVGLTGLEQWAKQTKQPMDRAILHSLIAGIYADYAANNQWELRRRTEIDSKYIRRESADKCERGSGGLCAAAQNVLTRLYSFCGIRGD